MKKGLLIGSVCLLAIPVAAIVVLDVMRAIDARKIETDWEQSNQPAVAAIATTSTIEVLPLVNWHSDRSDLKTEAGVSYLIKTDSETILFDVGFNHRDADPSPLEQNMKALGLDINDVDLVFLSHLHRDHLGGARWSNRQTFSPFAQQVDLSHAQIVAPQSLDYPGAAVQVALTPQLLRKGVATTGPISRRLFIGQIDEQALLLNLAGRGLVVVVGCGHQTVPRLLARIEASFDVPIHGVIGDLHYPLPEGRLKWMGIDAQRRLASGDGIFRPITMEQMTTDLDLLDKRLGFLMLGGHDTSDEVLARFSNRFGDRFHRATVGEPVIVD